MENERLTSEENDITQRIVGETSKGKSLRVGQYTTGYYYVTFTTGGKIPQSLSGRFMRYEEAEGAIKAYLGTRKEK
jgi:hypothetical protein